MTDASASELATFYRATRSIKPTTLPSCLTDVFNQRIQRNRQQHEISVYPGANSTITNAQQAEVNTQATLSPPPTTANHHDRAKFERNGP